MSEKQHVVKVYLLKRLYALAVLVALGGLLQLGALFLRSQHYFADLLSHFALFACVVLSLQLLISCICKHGRILYLLFSLWAIIFLYVTAYAVRQPLVTVVSDGDNTRPIRVLTFNVLSANRDQVSLIDYVLEQEADVVVLLEITHAWKDQLQRLTAQLPYSIARSRSDNFGIAVYARFPIDGQVQHVTEGGLSLPYIRALLRVGQQECDIWALHTLPPLNAERWAYNRRYLQNCLSRLSTERPSIVLGDLNTTATGALYYMLQDHDALVAVGAGYAFSSTWGPPFYPLLQLDHIFVSPEIRVVADALGPRCGSDHRPVCAELLLPE